MKIRLDDLKEDKESLHEKMIAGASKSYKNFRDYVSIQPDDSIGVMLMKLALNLVGVIFMLLLSPFFIIGLAVAFAAVI